MEKRKHKRIKKVMAIEIEGSYGMLTNLSQSGVFILPDALPKKFNNLKMTLLTDTGEMIRLQGSIVRIEEQPGQTGKFGLGLSLISPPEEYINYVQNLEHFKDIRDLPLPGTEGLEPLPELQPAAPPPVPSPKEERALDTILQDEKELNGLLRQTSAPPAAAQPAAADEQELEMLLQSTTGAAKKSFPEGEEEEELSLDKLFD